MVDSHACVPLTHYLASGGLWKLCEASEHEAWYEWLSSPAGRPRTLSYPALPCLSPALATAVKRCQPSYLFLK